VEQAEDPVDLLLLGEAAARLQFMGRGGVAALVGLTR
jgi:hypothetical protein